MEVQGWNVWHSRVIYESLYLDEKSKRLIVRGSGTERESRTECRVLHQDFWEVPSSISYCTLRY